MVVEVIVVVTGGLAGGRGEPEGGREWKGVEGGMT